MVILGLGMISSSREGEPPIPDAPADVKVPVRKHAGTEVTGAAALGLPRVAPLVYGASVKPLHPRLPSLDEPLEFLCACHRRVEERLLALERAVAAFGAPGHPDWAEAVEAVQGAARHFEESGRRHHEDESASLFPRLLAADPEMAAVIAELEAGHEEMDALHRELCRLALALVDPDETPLAVAALPALVESLCGAYRPHIRTEEERVFPRAREVLGDEAWRAISEEMRDRRQPQGPQK
jgi:hemerythrin-like domain-containing protein